MPQPNDLSAQFCLIPIILKSISSLTVNAEGRLSYSIKGTLNMQVSAEHPLVGNDADNEKAQDDAPAVVRAKHENEQIRPRSQEMSFAFRFEPPGKKTPDADIDDGPIIRRIDGSPAANFAAPRRREMRTPRLFPQHPVHNEAVTPKAPAERVPAMEESLLGDLSDARDDGAGYRPSNVNFSVSAIRSQRMRRPAGTRKSGGIAVKLMIATFVGITCISSGITLGLYGPELGAQIERQANKAGVSLAGLMSWPGDSSSQQSQIVSKAASSQPATTRQATVPRATKVGFTNPVARTGSKIFYDRIPPSTPSSNASLEPVNAAAAKLTGLAKHLAVPDDLQSFSLNQISSSTE